MKKQANQKNCQQTQHKKIARRMNPIQLFDSRAKTKYHFPVHAMAWNG